MSKITSNCYFIIIVRYFYEFYISFPKSVYVCGSHGRCVCVHFRIYSHVIVRTSKDIFFHVFRRFFFAFTNRHRWRMEKYLMSALRPVDK